MLALQITPKPPLSQWPQALAASEDQTRKAAVRALNKTARWLRTQVTRDTARSLDVKVGAVRPGLVLLRARNSRPEAGVALAKTAGVIKAAALGTPRQTARGVRVGRRHWDHAFLADMPNGHQGVFRRRGKARLPIQEVQLVVTGRMANVMEDLSDGPALRHFETLFQRELRYLSRVA